LLKRKAIVWDGELRVEERLGAYVPPGTLLVRVKYAAWTGVEEAVRQGLLVPEKGVVVGVSGIGQVVEAGRGAGVKPGEYVASTRIVDGVPGIDVDGFLAEYTIVQEGAASIIPRSISSPLYSLSLPASLACNIVEVLERENAETVLVVGAGLTGVLAYLVLEEKGFNVDLYTRLSAGRECGVEAVHRPRSRYDGVIAVSVDWHTVPGDVGSPLLLLHPALQRIILRGRGHRRIYWLRGMEGRCWIRVLEDHADCIRGLTGSVDGVILPPPLHGRLLAYILHL